MDTLTQLLVLPEENIGTPDVTILPESYPIRSRPGEYVDIIIVGSTFFGMELVERQHPHLVSQCCAVCNYIERGLEYMGIPPSPGTPNGQVNPQNMKQLVRYTPYNGPPLQSSLRGRIVLQCMIRHGPDKKGYLYDFVRRAAPLVHELLVKNDVHLYSFAVPESCFDVRLVTINWDPSQPRKVKAVVVDSNTPTCGLPSAFSALSTEPLTITSAGILPGAPVSSTSNNMLKAASYTPFQQIVSVSPFRMTTSVPPALPPPTSNSTSSVTKNNDNDDISVIEKDDKKSVPDTKSKKSGVTDMGSRHGEKPKQRRLSRKRSSEHSQDVTEYKCSSDVNSDKIVLKHIGKSDGGSNYEDKKSAERKADMFLKEAEKCLERSEELTKKIMEQDVNETIDDMINRSGEMDRILTNGNVSFDVDSFIQKMCDAISEEDRAKIASELNKTKGNKQKSRNQPRVEGKNVNPNVKKTEAVTKKEPGKRIGLRETSASLITRFKSVFEVDSNASQRKTNPSEWKDKYPAMRKALESKTVDSKMENDVNNAMNSTRKVMSEERTHSFSFGEKGIKETLLGAGQLPKKWNTEGRELRSILKVDYSKSAPKKMALSDKCQKSDVSSKLEGAGSDVKKNERYELRTNRSSTNKQSKNLEEQKSTSGEQNMPKRDGQCPGVKSNGLVEGSEMKKPSMTIALAHVIRKESNTQYEKIKPTSAPPPAHMHKPTSCSLNVQVCALDLSRPAAKKYEDDPLYVDGANDSRESQKSDAESISSDLLRTQGDPTQPASPPVYISSSESQSGESTFIVIDDTATNTPPDNDKSSNAVVESEQSDNDSPSEVLIDYRLLAKSDYGGAQTEMIDYSTPSDGSDNGNESEMNNDSTMSEGTGNQRNLDEDVTGNERNNDADSTVSNFSTLTTSTHGTFDSRNISREAGTEIKRNMFKKIGADDNSEVEGIDGDVQSLNATCNIDMDKYLEGEGSNETVSGGNNQFQWEYPTLTLDDLVHDEDYKEFKKQLFFTSSPKPAPTATKRKILEEIDGRSSTSSSQSSGSTSAKKRRTRPGTLYGPVNNPKGWLKMRCPDNGDDSFLPDITPDATTNPMWSGNVEDEVLDEDYRYNDASSEKSDSSESGTNGLKTVNELQNESADCSDLIEKMRGRNLKVAAVNAMGGKGSFYSDEMTIPELIQMAMQHMHRIGILSNYLRRLLQSPYDVENKVPVLTPNATILLKQFKALINREIKLYLDDNNVDIRPIEESRLLRFHCMVTNALVKVIPSRHLEFDHLKKTVGRVSQVDTGKWPEHAFTGYLEMYDRLKIGAKHPVVNPAAFWQYFSDDLKRVGIRRSPEACERMEEAILERYRAIKGDVERTGRDALIYDVLSQCSHLNPPVVGSSTVGRDNEVSATTSLNDLVQARDKRGRFAKKDPRMVSTVERARRDINPTIDLTIDETNTDNTAHRKPERNTETHQVIQLSAAATETRHVIPRSAAATATRHVIPRSAAATETRQGIPPSAAATRTRQGVVPSGAVPDARQLIAPSAAVTDSRQGIGHSAPVLDGRQVIPPSAAGHGGGNASGLNMWPSLDNYAPVARSKSENVMSSLGELLTNSRTLTTALVSLSQDMRTFMQAKSWDRQDGTEVIYDHTAELPSRPMVRQQPTSTAVRDQSPDLDEYFSPFVNYTRAERSRGKGTKRKQAWSPPPLPRTPPPVYQVCSMDCPTYCEKVFEN